MSEDVVRARGLYAGYGRITAIRGVTLSIPKGPTLIVGPNGSGKSTLLKVIAGVLRPARGEVRVLGLDPYKDLGRLSPRIMLVSEADTIPYTSPVSSVSRSFKEIYNPDLIDQGMELLELKKHLDKRVGSLSQGLRRRLSLLEALASQRELILLDEPYRGLDRHSRSLVSKALEEIASRSSIIITSHIAPQVDFKTLIVMEDGKIVYHGPPERVDSLGCCMVVNCNGEKRVYCNKHDMEESIRSGCNISLITC